MTSRAAVLGIVMSACVTTPDPPCAPPRPLLELQVDDDFDPWMVPGRTEVYFTGRGNGYNVYQAVRSGVSGTFNAPTLIESHTAGSDAFSPLLSANGQILWWVVGSGDSGGLVHQARRQVDGTFSDTGATVFSELGEIGHFSMTDDELHVFFTQHTRGNFDLYTASRATPGELFGQPQELVALNTIGDDAGPTITPDGSVLYFNSPRFGDASDQANNIGHLGFATAATGFTDPQPLAAVPPIGGKEDLFGSVIENHTFVFVSSRPVPGIATLTGHYMWIACE